LIIELKKDDRKNSLISSIARLEKFEKLCGIYKEQLKEKLDSI